VIFLVQSVGPIREPLLSEALILLCAARQSIEVPAPRVWMADDDQGNPLSRVECQRRFRSEQAFLVTGFDDSHKSNSIMRPERPVAPP
jgi:hypothetical protein